MAGGAFDVWHASVGSASGLAHGLALAEDGGAMIATSLIFARAAVAAEDALAPPLRVPWTRLTSAKGGDPQES